MHHIALHCIALLRGAKDAHAETKSSSARNAEGKESPIVQKAEGREVLRREMLRARKVLLCEKLKADKFFSAKHRGHCNKCKRYDTFLQVN